MKSFKEGVILDDGYKTMPSELEIIRAGMEPDRGLNLGIIPLVNLVRK